MIIGGYVIILLYLFVPHVLTYVAVVLGFIIASEYRPSKGHGVLIFALGLIEIFLYSVIKMIL